MPAKNGAKNRAKNSQPPAVSLALMAHPRHLADPCGFEQNPLGSDAAALPAARHFHHWHFQHIMSIRIGRVFK
jgi:hypothetical protein